jgi:hypothetical protein
MMGFAAGMARDVSAGFAGLTPDRVLGALEACGLALTYASPTVRMSW